MGTNYYALGPSCPNPCAHCRHDPEVHIGKNLVMFEAHEETPWGPVESWADWKRVLVEHGITVRDEHGTVHEVAGFIAAVEATRPDDRRRQYQWLVDHGYPLDRDFLDPDGFSFTRGEFS